MDSANVKIHFSYLTQDENKYPAQHCKKGSDKNQFIVIEDGSESSHVKLWCRAKKTSIKW